MTVQKIPTRFRAYQLGECGSSFSYWAGNNFTLIEARITSTSLHSLREELKICGKQDNIDVLHITSWDNDHCNLKDLKIILEHLQPSSIEYPGYAPHSENGRNCLKEINEYKLLRNSQGKNINAVSITPDYIKSLKTAGELRYENSLCWPKFINPTTSNDNSTVKIFREGAFNVASLGDVENENISAFLRRIKTFSREVDIMILAHHGANCATNSKTFLEKTNPTVVICSSNYSNEYSHPRPEVRNTLHELGIPIFTTKTGDVIITVTSDYSHFKVTNLQANSSKISSEPIFEIKKHRWLSMNMDTLRNVFGKQNNYRSIGR
jgi:competence protein ComEC